MASIFNALNIGYSGLNAAQVGIDTTGHNISNAETEGYTRQRVVTSTAYPVGIDPGLRGNGTQIQEIVRVFDNFVFNRYTSTAQNKEYSDMMKKTLEELSSYFPDVENVGIKTDLQGYFNAWESFANNPSNVAVKVALSQQTQTLTQHIQQTRTQVSTLQMSLNDQLEVNINEVNRIAEEIAKLNKSISEAESAKMTNANDLRDQRSQLEMTLSKLIGAKTFVGQIEMNAPVDSNIAVKNGSYTIQVGGFNIVDGSTFHPIGIRNVDSSHGYNSIYYERQDGVRIPFEEHVKEGKIGAILELRGSTIGSDGEFENGFLQETIDHLDLFAKGLIEATNNIYAQSATNMMRSNVLPLSDKFALLSSDENFKAGTFDVIVYDADGKEVGRRSVNVNAATVIKDNPLSANSILGQLSADVDDNKDNNSLNDIDNMLNVIYSGNQFSFDLKGAYAENGYTFAIEDHGTNFAGVTGLSRFFDGSSAKDIALASDLTHDVNKLRAFKAPQDGDNQIALDMLQIQFTKLEFNDGRNTTNETVYGYFDSVVTRVGTKTNSVILTNDTLTAQFNAIKMEFDSISKVSIDEEMTNLIRYQTSYGAAAKVITTIDQMMNTLLGLKQ